MNIHLTEFLNKVFPGSLEALPDQEKRVVNHFVNRTHISRNTNEEFEEKMTFGQRIADKVASFGGSWTFIFIFTGILILWILLNTILLVRKGKPYDPYPFILLNLVLSMVAAMQAPVIMMSQNRHSAKDRMDATHDYEVNLKSEFEILSLHEKVDEIREKQYEELLKIQQDQIKMLKALLKDKGTDIEAPDQS
jgi:uncharacterized membrane protein